MQDIQQTIVEKGKEIYYRVRPTLKKQYQPSDYVTIEVASGKYYVGKTPIEALHKARKYFPRKQFFLAQVGRLAGTLK